jgi:predicted P-loop ATPase
MNTIINLNLWKKELETDQNGNFKRSLSNVRVALKAHFAEVFAFDAFAQRPMVLAAVPWNEDNQIRLLDENDITRTHEWLQLEGIAIGARSTVTDALLSVCHDNAYHPVRDYLDSLEWDGSERIDTWFTMYYGVTDSAYTRAAGRKFLIGAVARVMEPGCKMDYMPVLEGSQGTFKSTSLKKLADPWVLEDLADMKGKDGKEQIQGRWIIEVSELDAMKRSEKETIKAFISTRVDIFRPPYGRLVREYPRQCVLVGTTNSDHYLQDETGNRRFWPVKCGYIDLDAIERDRDQLWAEATHAYRNGEAPYIDNSEASQQAALAQGQRYASHPWEEKIASWLEHMHETTQLRIAEDCLELSSGQLNRSAGMQISTILTSLGWKRDDTRIHATKNDGAATKTYKWVNPASEYQQRKSR